jgi:hypothetical protein
MLVVYFLNRLEQNVPRDQDKRREADYKDRIKKVFAHDGTTKSQQSRK